MTDPDDGLAGADDEAVELANRRTVAVCRGCDWMVVPFSNVLEALEWVQAHRDGTGHEIRTVSGWPDPETAVAKAFPDEKR